MKAQSGLTLIEVLIAVVVLAIGLLGIAGLQSAALSNNLIAYQYTQASTLAQATIERMRANRQGVLEGAYLLEAAAGPPSAPVNCASAACSPAQQAKWDLANIYAQLLPAPAPGPVTANLQNGPRGMLPGGRLSITCVGGCTDTDLRIVTIYWDVNRNNAAGTACTSGRDQLRCLRLGYIP